MKKTRHIISIFLTVCVVISCMTGLAVTAGAEYTATWLSSYLIDLNGYGIYGYDNMIVTVNNSESRISTKGVPVINSKSEGITFRAPEGKALTKIVITNKTPGSFSCSGKGWKIKDDTMTWEGYEHAVSPAGNLIATNWTKIEFTYRSAPVEPIYTFKAETRTSWTYPIELSRDKYEHINRIEALIETRDGDEGSIEWGYYDTSDPIGPIWVSRTAVLNLSPGVKRYVCDSATLPITDTAFIKLKGNAKLLGYKVSFDNDTPYLVGDISVPEFAPPTANKIPASGEEAELLTPGYISGGTFEYRIGNNDWTEKIPTGKEEGSYTVYYHIKYGEDAVYTPCSLSDSITVTIGPIGERIPADDPDCTTNGNKEYYSDNGRIYVKDGSYYKETTLEDVTIKALGHNYKKTVIKKPTCTEKGETEYICLRCGESYKDHPKALGHSYKNGVCTRCGAKQQGSSTTTPSVLSMTGKLTEKHSNELSWSAVPGAKGYALYIKVNGKYALVQKLSGTKAEVICGFDGEYYVSDNGRYSIYTYSSGKFKKTGTLSTAKLGSVTVKNAVTTDYMVKYTKDGKTYKSPSAFKTSVTTYYKPEVKATAKKNGVTLKWAKVEGATKYRILVLTGGKLQKLAETKSTSYSINGLKSGKEYTYAVKAYVDGTWTTSLRCDLVKVKAK